MDLRLCAMCTGELCRCLRDLAVGPEDATGTPMPGLLADLEDTITRQDAVAPVSVGAGKSTETPLVFNNAASDLAWEARDTITAWAKDFIRANQHLRFDGTNHIEAAQWLSRFPSLLAQLDDADAMHSEIRDLHGRVQRMVDIPEDTRAYLGRCGSRINEVLCTEELYARRKDSTVYCRTCASEWDVDGRRRWLLSQVDSQVCTAPQASALLSRLGVPVSEKDIQDMGKRGEIAATGQNPRRQRLYRVGDVMDAVLRVEAA
ncbi:hypothetical protein N8J89_08025 [Crossiella sp. CA-258035]|uniref:hypothetical protein n=1 Tax=Crossiella sp. CA-258035 TaxID=2981138 RepID=UPI0024BBED9C|nr:hypothetical protein [Crossiella sp. CA-258035]WHT21002.1 hypothetical protein N8J89_08025 [Crossiella sp. CA-258035]